MLVSYYMTREHLAFLMACSVISKVISLVLRDSDTDSESVSLRLRSVSGGQKTCSSKGLSLMGL